MSYPTGRIQYNKMVNNASDISVKRVEGYYVNESGAVDRNRMGNASLTAIMKDTETGEIIGGKIDITLYMEAIKDDAKKRGMRVDDREAATLAEEIEHTEAENIQLQIEEQEREEKEKRLENMEKAEKADKMQLYQVKIGEETRPYQEGTSYGQIAEEFQKDYKDDIVLVFVDGKLLSIPKSSGST